MKTPQQDVKPVTDETKTKVAAYQERVRAALQKYQDGPKRPRRFFRKTWKRGATHDEAV